MWPDTTCISVSAVAITMFGGFAPLICAALVKATGWSAAPGPIGRRLFDTDDERPADLSAAGIDMAVLSHRAPSAQRLQGANAVSLVQRVNNRLAAIVARNPLRYQAFAALPTCDPEAAADELSRCVELGFRGAMLHGMANGEFLDLPKFWPIYARAEALDVPIYFHPSLPHPDVIRAYYSDYMDSHPLFARPGWGFGVETGTQGVRLLLSGVFERYPNLKVMLGHLGEGLPFHIWRIDSALSRSGGTAKPLRDMPCARAASIDAAQSAVWG